MTPDPDFEVVVFFEIKYAETVQDRAIVTILLNINRKSSAFYRMVSLPVTSSLVCLPLKRGASAIAQLLVELYRIVFVSY